MSETGLRVLLVEDEALIAMMAEDMIDSLGHRVVCTAATLTEALDLCTTAAFDAALLDVNLNGDTSMAIASALKRRGCPFAFTTGYGAGGVDPEHGDCPVLTKPYALGALEAVLAGFAAQLAGTSSITSSVDSNRG
jgi:CheY-like chemotaxis protein